MQKKMNLRCVNSLSGAARRESATRRWMKSLPSAHWDIQADYWLTEQELLCMSWNARGCVA